MSHQEEKNQAAKAKEKQQEIAGRPQNQQNQQNKQQQPGNRPQGQQDSLRDSSGSHLRADEGEQTSQRWSSENEPNNYDRKDQSGYDRNSQDR